MYSVNRLVFALRQKTNALPRKRDSVRSD